MTLFGDVPKGFMEVAFWVAACGGFLLGLFRKRVKP